VAVLVANASAWVGGWPVGPSGLLASTATGWDSVDVCGWLIWGMLVLRMVASTVMRPWPPTSWDGPSTESSLASLFLGGILCVFYRAHEHVGANVGICSRGLANPEHEKVKMKVANSKAKRTRHVSKRMEN
jgi:hypothetical protein